jgi:putative FmdB family regulatory protein
LKALQPEFELISMPIYAYKCESCGFAKDVLQKMSEAPLTDCPTCGVASFKKQLTAAGFQLKGSGWYATDFKGGGAGATGPAPATTATSASPSKSTEAAKPGDAAPKTDAAPTASAACH